MTARLELLCHASTGATRTAAFPDDEALEPQALLKLAALDFPFRDAARCWTSPALRAVQTAQFLRLGAGVEPKLAECGYGRWTGRPLAQVQAEEPDAVALWLGDPASAPHGGESVLALLARVAAWLDAQGGSPGRTLAVTHASVIKAAILHAIGAPPRSFWRIDVAPLSLAKFIGDDGRWTLASIGPLPARRG